MKQLLVIVGPTAVGKSALALRLAKLLGGEIVSADSRQVYRHMDIGTAKPSKQERSAAPHHLIDVVAPDEEYSLALFLRQATQAIADVQRRGGLPILVGGTGQYVWALLEGWQVPEVPPNPALRRRLEQQARLGGYAPLHKELRELNPAAASRIDPRNVRRVIRALEVQHALPKGRSHPPAKTAPPFQAKILGLTLERPALYQRIDQRVETMLASGWVEEVRGLLEKGYGPETPSLSSVGYRELLQHLEGRLPLEAAIERIKHGTHRFARHQHAWFRPSDGRISWLDASASGERVESEVARWLRADAVGPDTRLW